MGVLFLFLPIPPCPILLGDKNGCPIPRFLCSIPRGDKNGCPILCVEIKMGVLFLALFLVSGDKNGCPIPRSIPFLLFSCTHILVLH